MSTPSVIYAGAGFRFAKVLALDANGIIYSTGTTAYSGVTVSGARALTINDPEPRQLVHVGDDRPFAMTVLPALEPITGQLRTGKTNDTLDIALQGVKDVVIGEANLYPIGTNKRGEENRVCLLAFQVATDVDPASANFGKQLWQFRLFPSCYVIPLETNNYDENVEEKTYTVRPQFVTKYPWGVAFSDTTEGCTQAQGFRGVAEHKPDVCAFVTDNATTSFTLPTTASTTAKIAAWYVTTAGSGSVSTPTTSTVNALSYTTAPSTGTLVVKFEHA